MKICVISSTVFPCPPPGYSGLEQIAWQIATGLVSKGHHVSLVAPEGSRCDGGEVIPTGPPGTWDEAKAFQSYHSRLSGFDVIIDHTWMKFSYIHKGEGRLRVPVLGVLHAPVNTMYGSLPPNVDKPCFVCISQDQAQHFEALHSRPARVAYNGVDLENFYKPLNLPRTTRFLFLARFSTIKGPDLAIEACKQAGAELDLIGDTSITQEPEYFEKCKKMCDGEQIRMVGPAPRGQCVWWYSQAVALLHPNKFYREPFGLAPVEAMGCRCPVVAWKYGAMKETVCEGISGNLVESVEEMANVIRNARGWFDDSYRNHCQNWAQRFSVQNMVDRYEVLCEEALATGGW